jgi:hypothetical protein
MTARQPSDTETAKLTAAMAPGDATNVHGAVPADPAGATGADDASEEAVAEDDAASAAPKCPLSDPLGVSDEDDSAAHEHPLSGDTVTTDAVSTVLNAMQAQGANALLSLPKHPDSRTEENVSDADDANSAPKERFPTRWVALPQSQRECQLSCT